MTSAEEVGLTVRAVIWDFGGVFTSSPFVAFARYEAEHGLPKDFIRGVNATDPDTNAWAKLERSEIDAETFDVLFAAESTRLGYTVGGRDVLALLAGEVRSVMVSALMICREKLKCACITNNAKVGQGPGMTFDQKKSKEVSKIIDLFDLVIESSKVGYRKPDPEIYRIACRKLGIEPSEAVYLDDLGINLKPARAMGMKTIKVTDPDAALRELEAAVGFSLE
ncbi:MAG: HAD-IA family hydrolase [Alphaproteobacteria bacterium]|nr:HAD-IA family hydrolase [Alphaproteobacteria bacterium]